MRILVTGGTGQIGAALVPRLAALGAVVAPNRAELDFARPSDLAEQLDRIAPHLIINCAAYTNVDAAEDQRDLAFTVNAESPGTIARWAAAHRVPLVHLRRCSALRLSTGPMRWSSSLSGSWGAVLSSARALLNWLRAITRRP